MMKECAHQPCGQPFEAKRSDARFCSASCRAAASRARRQGVEAPSPSPRAAVIAADADLRGEVERLRGEVAALGRRVEAGRVEAERALDAVATELGLDRDETNERVGDLRERLDHLEGLDLVERMESVEIATRIAPGEEDPRSALCRLDRQVSEVEEAIEEMASRMRALEKWGTRLEKEMARAVTLLVGVE